ncbi:MAG: BtrH N-terminal domain-containing protein [Spirochaetota bacterium]
MPELSSFSNFGGAFPTTSSLANTLATAGFTAPHTGKPYSEALLMGLAGGAAFGYFSFAYKGHDPQANIVTRNTFGSYGWDAAVERLGLEQDVVHSTSASKAQVKLREALESGHAPIVWVDVFSLGYESSDLGEGMWASTPVVVARYEEDGVTLSDRSSAPIVVSKETFDAARARIKKDKFRLVTVDLPQEPDLTAAVKRGVQDALALYDGDPPQGSGKNWGFGGIDLWQERLSKGGTKESWEKLFPPGRPFFCGLTSAYRYALQFWEDDSRSADRLMFARFLSEAAETTGLEAFAEASDAFSQAGVAWQELGTVLLPGDVEILAHARAALEERDMLFRESGNARIEKLKALDIRIEKMRDEAEQALADPNQCAAVREQIASHLETVGEREAEAVERLRAAYEATA